jgi:ABC-2 type transport system permease protein
MIFKPFELNRTVLLLGFVPFFRKEIQEWKRKKRAIAVLILVPLAFSIGTVLLGKMLGQGSPNVPSQAAPSADDLIFAGTVFSTTQLWVYAVTILLSIGLIPKEQDAGTLAWNLTKPLSRPAFLLAKWLVNTVSIWLIAVVVADSIALFIAVIELEFVPFPILTVLLTNVLALLPIGFWVLFCLLFGFLLKDQAAIGACAVFLIAAGIGILGFEIVGKQPLLAAIAPYYPTHVIEGFITLEGHFNVTKFLLYLAYMTVMTIATGWLFDRKEFSS